MDPTRSDGRDGRGQPARRDTDRRIAIAAIAISAGFLALATGAAIGVATAAVPVLLLGPVPDAWSTALVVPPLVLGWVVQVLAGSWTHLIPAIGGGGPAGHALRRHALAPGATARLVAINTGAALCAIGWPAGLHVVAGAGLVLYAVGIAASIGLVMRALAIHPPGVSAAAR